MFEKSSHSEWLSLLEVSGPFLAEPVLEAHFPQGLEGLDSLKKRHTRQAYEEWREAHDNADPDFEAFHKAWIDLVLKETLELDEDDDEEVLKPAAGFEDLVFKVPEYGVTISPDYAVITNHDQPPSLLIQTLSAGEDIDTVNKADAFAASPVERMVQLCRAKKVRLGLLTNGERWMLIDAPEGGVTSYASWYARLWSQEPVTLQAFVNLLGIRRFFLDSSQQLPALLDESVKHQDEVTDALGGQVSRAVEVLIQALDKADQDKGRELLKGIEPSELYEAGLTVMMRLVFLLSAEERGLLLLGDERYEAYYAVSTLRMQLREQAGLHSEEILSHRRDAWARLLAIFRAVYGGIEHESLRMPALGGSLFDPDRFAFLEGRAKGSNWRYDPAQPLPIDNRTVLLLLDAIQLYQGRTLSYRALDVEQIGYVYEGLLERTVIRAPDMTLEVSATKSSKKPWITYGELEDARLSGDSAVKALLEERTGSSKSRINNDLNKPASDAQKERLLVVCQGDSSLRDRLAPFYNFLRIDPWGYPLIYLKGAFLVASGSDRRETGTHYTPKSLTESIVKETLEPVVYVGPAEGVARKKWRLKSAKEILDLKVCDLAMGSGAFLVQACRWLSERLIESWAQSEAQGKVVTNDGIVVENIADQQSISTDPEERAITARRLISERCLYGVDVNPMAVELAKLSLWLVTLAKGRPFGFLDHNLRYGDSLIGITDLDQLHYLELNVQQGSEKKLFAQKIGDAVREAIDLRLELRKRRILDIRDVDVMAHLDHAAKEKLKVPELVADALMAETIRAGGKRTDITGLSLEVGEVLEGDLDAFELLKSRTLIELNRALNTGKAGRRPFHWCLEFPEVFVGENSGFDAVIGNPPFLGGRRMRRALGDSYIEILTKRVFENGSANSNLCSFFLLRATNLIDHSGYVGIVATSAIREGDTKNQGLDQILSKGGEVYRAVSLMDWPGNAAVTVSLVWITKTNWSGKKILDGELVDGIDASLSPGAHNNWIPKSLKENLNLAFQGSNILGQGFVLSLNDAEKILRESPAEASVIDLFLKADDFTKNPRQASNCKIINFRDYPLSRETSPSNYDGPVAEDFPICLSRVERFVKPGRINQKRKPYRERWWQYAEQCGSLYSAISSLSRVIFQPSPSKHLVFAFVDSKQVFSGPHTVIAQDKISDLGILLSTVHSEWCWTFGTTMPSGSRRYSPSDFKEFPRARKPESIEPIAKELDLKRTEIMEERGIGLTKLMDLFHDEKCCDDDIKCLINIQEKLDFSVLQLYGWDDLSPSYKYKYVGRRKRYGFADGFARIIVNRLIDLNKKRYGGFSITNSNAKKREGVFLKGQGDLF